MLMINMCPDIITDLKSNRVILEYYLERLDEKQYIRIISPHHDIYGKLSDYDFNECAYDLKDMRVYNIYVDENGMTVFDLGVEYDK